MKTIKESIVSKTVERSRNKLLYDSVVRGILETESNLAYENKKIYLVILSVITCIFKLTFLKHL